jgi:hypothetical protein
MRILLGILTILLILTSCRKAEDRRCLKTIGDESERIIETESFDKLYLKEKLRYVLVQDTVEKVVLKGGENLLNFIDVKVVDGRLELYNENKCNFLRNLKKKVVAEIHFKTLINIHFEGTEELRSEGGLNFSWLTLLIRDGAGPVKLDLQGEAIFATVSHGWGDFTFTGNVKHANLNVKSNGWCDTYGLNVEDSITVVSNTPATLKVNADGAALKAELDGSGDIWYIGSPIGTPVVYQYGTGELIQQ